MTRPRTSTPRRASSSRPRSRGNSSRGGSSSTVMWIVGLAAGLAAIVLVAMNSGGDTNAGSSGGQPAADARADRKSAGETPASPDAVPSLAGGTERDGEAPGRPAPPIAAADLALAQQHYERAKELWNDGQRARSAGDTATYTQAMDDAFDAMEAQRDALRTYTDWYEEADLDGWRMPAEYDALARRLGEYDRMYQKIKKVKQIR